MLFPDEDQCRQWTAAAQRGNASAYRRLLEALAPWFKAMHGSRCAPSDADDLAQESLLAVHLKLMTYDPAQPFLPWAASIARHKRVDFYRRRHRAPEAGAVQVPEGSRGPAASSGFARGGRLADEDREFIEQLIATLPAEQARAIRAVKLEQLSVADAAARLARSVSWVKVNVHRGMKALARNALKSLPPLVPNGTVALTCWMLV